MKVTKVLFESWIFGFDFKRKNRNVKKIKNFSSLGAVESIAFAFEFAMVFDVWVWQVAEWVLLTAKCDKTNFYSSKNAFSFSAFCCFFIFSLCCWSIALLVSLWSNRMQYNTCIWIMYRFGRRFCNLFWWTENVPLPKINRLEYIPPIGCESCTLDHYQSCNVESLSYKFQLLTEWIYVLIHCFH